MQNHCPGQKFGSSYSLVNMCAVDLGAWLNRKKKTCDAICGTHRIGGGEEKDRRGGGGGGDEEVTPVHFV